MYLSAAVAVNNSTSTLQVSFALRHSPTDLVVSIELVVTISVMTDKEKNFTYHLKGKKVDIVSAKERRSTIVSKVHEIRAVATRRIFVADVSEITLL